MKNKKSAGKIIGVGAGIAALAAAGYLLFGPDGEKNKKKLKGWALRMKGEILEKMEKAETITEGAYHKMVDEVSVKYGKNKAVGQKELKQAIAELKRRWKETAKAAAGKTGTKRKK